ncbi:hypothetical protein ACLQ2E_16830 [Streptomyces lavendulocolor]
MSSVSLAGTCAADRRAVCGAVPPDQRCPGEGNVLEVVGVEAKAFADGQVIVIRAFRHRDAGSSAKEPEVGRPPLVHRMKRTNATDITDCCKRILDEPEFKHEYVTHLVARLTCASER